MYKRILYKPIESGYSFFLLGPRGTGKTNWVRNMLDNAHVYINLLNANTFRTLDANPSRIGEYLPTNKATWIFIDEVQRVPEMLNDVHYLIEEGYRFVLTVSSARKLRRGGVNLLVGRARMHTFHPLIMQEIGSDFSLLDALSYGLLPTAYNLRKKPEDALEYLSAYINSYLTEEIKEEGIVRKISYFNRFLEIASFSQGQPINTTNIARECFVSRLTVDNYFSILEDLLLGSFLPPFTSRAKREIVKQPKFYFFDVGVYRNLRQMRPLDNITQVDGPALETLVLQHLSAINDYSKKGYRFYYWRTKYGFEVDFIAYKRGHPIIAIEVKGADYLNSKDFKGLKSFKEQYSDSKCYMIYKGRPRKEGEITVMNIVDFLALMPSLLGTVTNI